MQLKIKRSVSVKKIAFLCAILLIAVFISSGISAGAYKLLQEAAESNNTRAGILLLALGTPASPKKRMYNWYYFAALTDTPLHSAAKNGNLELAQSLIQHGAYVDWCCCSCVTPLHDAIRSKNYEMVKLLLDSRADTNISFDLTLSVLELAKLKSTPEIVKLIEAHNLAFKRDALKRAP
jgi:hypothetical protein